MPHLRKLPVLLFFMATTLGLAWSLERNRGVVHNDATRSIQPSRVIAPEDGDRALAINFNLQPEALKLSRRIGRRPGKADRVSVASGTLTTSTGSVALQLVRRQQKQGERMELGINGAPAMLSWSDGQSGVTSGGDSNEAERVLLERLALDSVDHFLLAQFTGASYYIVARNVRPAEAGDSDAYDGPLWNIVRVDERRSRENKRALSSYRLYYFNTTTGLIDKIVSEFRGEPVEATFSKWRQVNGEHFPSRTVWKKSQRVIMEFEVTSFVS